VRLIRRGSFKVGALNRRTLLASVGLAAFIVTVQTLTTAGPSLAVGHPGAGTISGVLETMGGPPNAGPRPLPGIVNLTSASGRHIKFVTGKNGSIRGHLTPGTYEASGHSPQANLRDCEGESPVVVRAGHRTRFIVACEIP
jgi:hypothetical protein